MKLILHIITSLGDGGAEAALFRLVKNCGKYRHIVVSLTDEGKYGSLLQGAEIGVFCLRMPAGRVTVRGIIELYRIIKETKPFIVQTWMYHADLLGGSIARIAGVEKVFWGIRNTTLDIEDSKKSTIFVARLCALTSCIIPEKIICCAYSSLKVHQKLGYKKEKLRLVNNGYDVSEFYPDPEKRFKVRKELRIRYDTPLIGMVARFHAQKDHFNLLRSLGLLRGHGYVFNCLLVGSNIREDNTTLTREIVAQGLVNEVILIGPRHDISSIMNALDINVLSSSFGEAFPNVLCEAMASGTPCVATDVGDSAVIVGKTGWIVPPKNATALARCLAVALDELPQETRWGSRKEMAREQIVENFSLDNMIVGFHAEWSGVNEFGLPMAD